MGEVRHRRVRPTAHAFRYASFHVRLPMRALDDALRSCRWLSHDRFNLLSFHDADHGPKGSHGERDLVAWIDRMLVCNGICDAGGPLWLETFPRILGYAFKPVSFWFCHREDGALRAVVCEVNNTFGERHCYLLAHRDGSTIADGETLVASKVLHVSPFCRVDGCYRFRFAHREGRTLARIDYEDGDGPLLSTSLSGRLEAARPSALLVAFARRPLFSFGVIARIHWQALRLWTKRVPAVGKPRPPAADVSRGTSS